MPTLNVLPQLIEMGFDQQTAVAALSSAIDASSYAMKDKSFVYGDSNNGFEVKINREYQVSCINIDQSIWQMHQAKIQDDKKNPAQKKVMHTILFSFLSLDFHVKADDWVQLSPVRTELLASSPFGAEGYVIDPEDRFKRQIPRPFVIEVKYQPSNLIWVESIERFRALENAKLLLAAWINTPLIKGINSYNWVIVNGKGPQIALGSMPSGLDQVDIDSQDFSDVSRFEPAPIIPIQTYVDEVVPGQQIMRTTDLPRLKRAFDNLSAGDQRRYLRCCSGINDAQYNDRQGAQAIVSYISAVEALLDPTQKCEACGNHTGINAAFKHFVDQYIQPSQAIRSKLYSIYALRSKLAHGAYSLNIDEPFMGLELSGCSSANIASWIAKKGAVKWLIERSQTKKAQ